MNLCNYKFFLLQKKRKKLKKMNLIKKYVFSKAYGDPSLNKKFSKTARLKNKIKLYSDRAK